MSLVRGGVIFVVAGAVGLGLGYFVLGDIFPPAPPPTPPNLLRLPIDYLRGTPHDYHCNQFIVDKKCSVEVQVTQNGNEPCKVTVVDSNGLNVDDLYAGKKGSPEVHWIIKDPKYRFHGDSTYQGILIRQSGNVFSLPQFTDSTQADVFTRVLDDTSPTDYSYGVYVEAKAAPGIIFCNLDPLITNRD